MVPILDNYNTCILHLNWPAHCMQWYYFYPDNLSEWNPPTISNPHRDPFIVMSGEKRFMVKCFTQGHKCRDGPWWFRLLCSWNTCPNGFNLEAMSLRVIVQILTPIEWREHCLKFNEMQILFMFVLPLRKNLRGSKRKANNHYLAFILQDLKVGKQFATAISLFMK